MKIILLLCILLLTACGSTACGSRGEACEFIDIEAARAPDEMAASVDPAAPAEFISPAPTAPHLSPQEAREIYTQAPEAILFLDVRTDEEFNDFRIYNALHLPYERITTQASVAPFLPDAAQIIFVYCHGGRRSRIAADALVALGYTRVYDIGSVFLWRGEMLHVATETVFLHVFNREPRSISTPVDVTVAHQIHRDLPVFYFHLRGYASRVFWQQTQANAESIRYDLETTIQQITITGACGLFFQEITDLDAHAVWAAWWGGIDPHFGLSFEDWNFDGFADFSLPAGRTWGYSGGWPRFYFLWCDDAQRFIRNDFLKGLSVYDFVYAMAETQQVRAWQAHRNMHHARYYAYEQGTFTPVRYEFTLRVQHPRYYFFFLYRTKIYAPYNGQMVLVRTIYEDYTPEQPADAWIWYMDRFTFIYYHEAQGLHLATRHRGNGTALVTINYDEKQIVQELAFFPPRIWGNINPEVHIVTMTDEWPVLLVGETGGNPPHFLGGFYRVWLDGSGTESFHYGARSHDFRVADGWIYYQFPPLTRFAQVGWWRFRFDGSGREFVGEDFPH